MQLNNNTMWFEVWNKVHKKHKIHNNYDCDPCRADFASKFLALNLIGDVHEARDLKSVQLYEDMPHNMDDGLVAQRPLGYYLRHPHAQMQGRMNLVHLRRSCCEV